MKIKLICDSLCDIPKEIKDKDYVDIVPLTIIFNDKEYKDNIDLSNEQYYKMLRSSENLPKTSQVTYIQFKEVFDKYIEEGYDILCITGASKSSGTFQSATIAKNDNEASDRIYVFDTMNLSLGSGQYVIKATELIEQSLSIEDIVKELDNIRDSVKLLFVPWTLEYLKRSGRVPVATAIIGNMLSIKPIFYFNNAEAEVIAKVRGSKHVATKLVDIILEMNDNNIEDKIVTIGYGDNYHDFEKLEEEVKKRLKARRIIYARGGSCICSHTGPDILAISCSR
ncbi:MAG: DegV family protein [Clostridium sp.]